MQCGREVRPIDDFAEFFDSNYGRVLRSVRLVVVDWQLAEDRTQEAFARAFRSWSRVAAMERPVTWVYVVALNAERRRWAREPIESSLDPPEHASPDVAGSVTTAVTVRQALERLTDRQRTMVVLRYFSDLTTRDIAHVMACAEGTVKATLHRALQGLRVDMEMSHDAHG
jgi:RNA polymerase sigma-70 factor (sigma-E family)